MPESTYYDAISDEMIDSTVIKKLEFKPKTRPGTLGIIPSLEQCQFTTPPKLVKFVWKLVSKRRPSIGTVIDLGAGDGIFALGGKFQSYIGYEIDSDKYGSKDLPSKVRIVHKDILSIEGKFDLAIGNPPFIRHQDISDIWKREAKERIQDEVGIEVNGRSNLYQYFMWMSLLRAANDGIVSLVVPFEWAFRPSSLPLREFIKANNWSVEIFKLPQDVFFEDIAAIPSITIIDKSRKWNGINVIELNEHLKAHKGTRGKSNISNQFEFSRRNPQIYAQRGFSSGSQEYFTLTDKARKQNRISLKDVVPCITTLKPLELGVDKLNKSVFRTFFVEKGYKCWLLKTNKRVLSKEVKRFLNTVPAGIRENWTCSNRSPWYSYKTPQQPEILYSSSFRKGRRPKIVINEIGARNISAVQGVYLRSANLSKEHVLLRLKMVDFSVGTFPTINNLRKIEVNQMNSILNSISKEELRIGEVNV